MAENDNTPMETVQLDLSENSGFGGGLNNEFGIEDTQILANNDLQSFLLNDPDDIQDSKKKEAEEKAKKEAEALKAAAEEKKNTPGKQPEKKEKEKEQPSGADILNSMLNGDDDEEQGGNQPNLNTGNEGDEDDTYTTLGKDLMRLGVFTKNSEDETEDTLSIKSPEDFLERFSLEKKKGAISILENFLSQYGEEYRKMFDSVFVNGVKPQDYLQSFAKIEAIKDLDLTQESNQVKVMKAYFRSINLDESKVDDKIQKLKDYGDLEDEAKTYHEILLNKEKEKAADLEKAKADEIEKTKEKDQLLVKSYQRLLAEKVKAGEIDGIPLTEKDAQEVLAYMVNKPYKLASGELLTELDKDIMELNRLENLETKLKLGLLMKKKLDLTSIKKATISKKSDTLFNLTSKNARQAAENKNNKQEIKSFF